MPEILGKEEPEEQEHKLQPMEEILEEVAVVEVAEVEKVPHKEVMVEVEGQAVAFQAAVTAVVEEVLDKVLYLLALEIEVLEDPKLIVGTEIVEMMEMQEMLVV